MPLQPFRDLGVIDGAGAAAGAANDLKRNQLLDLTNKREQTVQDEFQKDAPVREAQRGTELDTAALNSIVAGAMEVNPFLEANDIPGAISSLQRRRDTLKERGRSTTETDRTLSLLLSGELENIGQVKEVVSLIVGKAASDPSFGQPFEGLDESGNPKLFRGEKGGDVINTGISPVPSGGTEQFKTLTPDEIKAAGLPDGSFAQVGEDGKLVNIKTPPQSGEGIRQQKIDALIPQFKAQGMTDEQASTAAINRVDKNIVTDFNPDTGAVTEIDLVSKTFRELPSSEPSQPTPEPKQGQTLFDLADAATGPVASITARGAQALSFFGINPEQAAIGAQQRFQTEIQNLIRALAINPRFPVGEMERIREEINIQPSFAQGSGVLRQRMKSLDESLRLRLAQADRDAGDIKLDSDTRKSQGSNASAIRNFLEVLGADEKDPLDEELAALQAERDALTGENNAR